MPIVTLKRDGHCASCGRNVTAGARAAWDPVTRDVTCQICLDERAVGTGPDSQATAGASAHREYERRREAHADDVKAAHPMLGGLILALGSEPDEVARFERGASGERKVAATLAKAERQGVRLLSDRRVTHGRANIDHIAIGPGGVFIIDAKNYRGKITINKSLLSRTPATLVVGRRDCTKLVDGLHYQARVVTEVVHELDWATGCPIVQVLCFVEADWSMGTRGSAVDGVYLDDPKRALKRIKQDGPLTTEAITAIYNRLAQRLAPA